MTDVVELVVANIQVHKLGTVNPIEALESGEFVLGEVQFPKLSKSFSFELSKGA